MIYQGLITQRFPSLEHIKYPASKDPPPQTVSPANQGLSRKASVTPSSAAGMQPVVHNRTMSPSIVPSDSEDQRRAMSPLSTNSTKPPNGVIQQSFTPNGPINGRGKSDTRRRDDDESYGTDEGMDGGATTESYGNKERVRAMSPEQGVQQARAKSPGQFSAGGGPGSRAVSPNGDVYGSHPPNIAGVTMNAINGIGGRSSPAVFERSKTPSDNLHGNNAPGSPAPVVNGFVRPASRTGNGSVGNVAADLVRDLKSKDAELENVKKQMEWMKEALGSASKAGFTHASLEGNLEDEAGQDTEIALKFKRFKAQVQVCPDALLLLLKCDFILV